MKRIDKLTTAYILTSEDSREAKSYGYKVDTVKVRDGELKLGDLSLESWEFKVPDDKLGIKAVAAALGYGMPNVSSSDSEEAKEAYTDWGMKKNRNGFIFFNEPVVLLADQTAGYREIWGGVAEASEGYLTVDEDLGWYTDVYMLRTNLPDGGILVQSSSSAAYIIAEKNGTIWTLTLTMPVLADGTPVGSSYQSMFRGAFNWYHRQLKKDN